jgi:hypothetical protein
MLPKLMLTAAMTWLLNQHLLLLDPAVHSPSLLALLLPGRLVQPIPLVKLSLTMDIYGQPSGGLTLHLPLTLVAIGLPVSIRLKRSTPYVLWLTSTILYS